MGSYLCDYTDHLSVWGVARLFQEVAEYHTNETHIGYHDLIADNKAWVLTRMRYELHEMPAAFSNVTLHTWSRGCESVYALRDFELTDADGRCLCTATANWVVIDFETRKVCRLNDIMSHYDHHDRTATQVSKLEKLRLGSMDNAQQVLQMQVRESMLDHTQHVNNAEYLRWASDYWPRQDNPIATHSPFNHTSIDVNFLAETRMAETVSVVRCHTENSTDFQIANPRGISVVMRWSKI